MAEETMSEKAEAKAKAEAREKEFAAYSAPFIAKNKAMTGKGLRHFTSSTRGKGSMFINYQAFDVDKPETLPESLKEFSDITGVTDAKDLLDLLIEGLNAKNYETASDPIAEFVNDGWEPERKAQFRLVVRNMSKALGVAIDKIAPSIRTQVDEAFAAKQEVPTS